MRTITAVELQRRSVQGDNAGFRNLGNQEEEGRRRRIAVLRALATSCFAGGRAAQVEMLTPSRMVSAP